ncbi:RDD family protein, partial [Salmonella enterica]|nr:RDD family protein [Salmonella enterica]ECT8499034.1 RDD family protein [Salmonella enterica subsp. enterica serovar Pensacola]EDQ0314997.1 RDD family protein [Salmonella enterica subsp. enterica serovar Berta]EBG7270264.1 RDD family protein [Salmonella enterica]EBT4617031.1 RDD family protein [Salmonella enterica]
LGFFWIAFDRRKQGWHDKLAGTVVVRNTRIPSVKFRGRPSSR